ncbi:putative snare domain-containing protein [Rosellinia necatrix]|uniref:Putative snare domain-containing protein n=1 Tax=Rosellinia necatrix TaxID=77044 RepID=A0A1W2TK86_ROSNE|nr:putative snare domain-containing protein [Rosellinia necatrix]
MSFDQLSSVESGSGGGRRSNNGAYSDDPEFSRLSQGLMNRVFHLQGNISKLRTDISLLGTKRDNPRLRERVSAVLEESTVQFKEVGEGIKKIQAWSDVTPTQKYSQQKLSREFKAALAEFQSLQRTALEKQRASVSAAKSALDHETAGDAGASGDHQGEQLQLQQQQEQVHLAAQDEVDFQDALINEREEEIRHIEEGVSDLNVLFQQVAQIVSEQGEQLQTIEGNAVNVRDDTRGADQELRSAARYQKNARSKACCLLLVLVVIMTIVLLAVFLG